MKKLPAAQIQNIVFTAIVAIAAVVLYLCIGRAGELSNGLFATPQPTATPAPTQSLSFAPVPESIFRESVTNSKQFRAGKRAGIENTYNLVCGDEYTGAAVLTYTVNDDRYVSAFTLRFPCPKEPDEKSKEHLDELYAAMYPTYIGRQNEAMEKILRELLTAADLNGVFSEPVLMRWYTGAVAARDFKKYYSDTMEHCEFQAYPSQWGAENVVICSFLWLS